MTKNVLFFILTFLLVSVPQLHSQDDITELPDGRKIDLSTLQPPNPGVLVDEPEVWYSHSTGMVYIYLDATAYSEYTLYLTAPSGTMSFQATSSVVSIPADLARRLTYLLIDSDEVGTYGGSMNINTGGSTD